MTPAPCQSIGPGMVLCTRPEGHPGPHQAAWKRTSHDPRARRPEDMASTPTYYAAPYNPSAPRP